MKRTVGFLVSVFVGLFLFYGCTDKSIEQISTTIQLKTGAIQIKKGDFLGMTQEREHIYIQFEKLPSALQHKELKLMGVVLHQYFKQGVYSATVPQSVISSLREKFSVLGTEQILPEDKLTKELIEKHYYPWALTKDGLIQIEVYFFSDVLFLEAKQSLESIGIKVGTYKYGFPSRIALTINPQKVREIAQLDEVRLIDQKEGPNEDYLLEARTLSAVNALENSPSNYDLTGQGINVGMWDGNMVDVTHPDFNDNSGNTRIVLNEPAGGVSDHATHVAGIIGSTGDNDPNQSAQGMAPAVKIFSFDTDNVDDNDFDNDGIIDQPPNDDPEYLNDTTLSEKANKYGIHNLHIDNNSWGKILGWKNGQNYDGDNLFGLYNSITEAWDQLAVDHSNVLIVKSAGNDRDDADPNNAVDHDGTLNLNDNKYYFLLGPQGVAKNIVSVGSINENGQTSSIYSNWGPANDGRIKPDIVANGDNVYSTFPVQNGNPQYDHMSGTSMAAPVVSGIAALLYEQYKETFHTLPTSAEIKAILINTAKDVDEQDGTISNGGVGPSYSHGYGLVQALLPVATIAADDGQRTMIRTGEVETGESVFYTFRVPEDNQRPVRVTLVWTDPAGTSQVNNGDLVNDLDLTLTHLSNSNEVYYPWSLNKASPHQKASNDSRNSVDNVEKVEVGLNKPNEVNPGNVHPDTYLSPENLTGTWIVEVKGEAVPAPNNGLQEFAIVFSHKSTSGYLFSDIGLNDWYFDYVKALWEKGVIQGYEDGTFRPGRPVTRAEFVKMVVEASGAVCLIPIACPSPDYSDFDDDAHWAYEAVDIAYGRDWLDHEQEEFRPNAPILRAEALKIITEAKCDMGEGCSDEQNECEDDEDDNTKPFADVASGDWFFESACIGKKKKLVEGYSAGEEPCQTVQVGKVHLCPGNNIIRAEAAALVDRTFP